MEKFITYENLRSFAYSNDKKIKGEFKGAVINFFGLGGQMMMEENSTGDMLAEKGLLYVIPYTNPWSWLNKQAIDTTDMILDIIYERYGLDENLPVVSSGGSMGGHAAIMYTYYGKRHPVGCVASCPVCDLVYHIGERPDLPRTIYSAYFNNEGTMEENLKANSPMHLLEKLPDIRYSLFTCGEDKAVNREIHGVRFVEAMRKLGRNVEYFTVEGRGHCDLGDELNKIYKEKLCEYALK